MTIEDMHALNSASTCHNSSPIVKSSHKKPRICKEETKIEEISKNNKLTKKEMIRK